MHYYLIAFVAFISYIVYKCYIYPLYLSPLCKIPGPPVDSFILGHYDSFLSKQIGEASTRLAKQYVGIHSIFFAHGNSHKRQRKMMHPSFSFANVKEMFPTFVQAGHNLKDIWMKQTGFNYEFNSTKTTTELAQAYQTAIMRNPSQVYETIEGFFPFIKKLPTPNFKRHNDAIKVIQNASAKLVDEKKHVTVLGKDLLSLLVKANENLPVNEQLTNNELLSQVMTLLLAGHETTSTALSWGLYFLAKNPDAQDLLRKEILDVLINRDHMPTFEEIEHLKYLECVFKETLRIVPPFINGYVVPKGTPMLISIYAIHHDPSIWGDDAEDFNPSRWLDPVIESKVTTSNFLPFSAGQKSCLGMKMAHLEFEAILSVIIRNFKFKLVEGFNFETKLLGLSKPIPGIDLLISKVDY
ncbi:cytochrome P450 [Gigaspora margarita]|uniref:Cytochrome P450 n=1 Tax=Gigaspora margarita TaxID=4874 RepID=A0A8H4A3Q2_GIGMA|nr:cytochrome P450 [Gigaspora margarita]